jgi:hypothetical protein
MIYGNEMESRAASRYEFHQNESTEVAGFFNNLQSAVENDQITCFSCKERKIPVLLHRE